MYQVLLEQIRQSTKAADEHFKEIFDLIDKVINELEERCNVEVELSATLNPPLFSLTDTYMVTIENLMKLKQQLRDEMDLCHGVASRINNALSGTHGYPQSRRGHVMCITTDSLSSAAEICRDASSSTHDQMTIIADTLYCFKKQSDNQTKSKIDVPSCSILDSEMNAFVCKIQDLGTLYEKLSEYCLEARRIYQTIEENIVNDFTRTLGEYEKSDADARRRALADALRTSGPVVAPMASSNTNIAEHHYDDAILVPDGKLAGGCFCRVCGNTLSVGANYCSYCGSKTQIDTPKVELPKVNFSAIAPKELIKGEYSLIEIIMYENAFRNEVEQIIANSEASVKEIKGSVLSIEKNAHIKIVLNSLDLAIDDNVEEQCWCGEYARFTFPIELPLDYRKPQILFTASVYIDDVIATRLKFVAKCKTFRGQKIEIKRDDILSAFVSYASQDRHRVAMIIQGMKKARPDLDIFFDVESLRSGDDWENALWTEIDKRDILFLCWSHFAKESKWVDAEWRYALSTKGVDCIEPVPIESPDVCPPPDELTRKHFNDKLLYIINSVKEQ